jgi:hypothetical protein
MLLGSSGVVQKPFSGAPRRGLLNRRASSSYCEPRRASFHCARGMLPLEVSAPGPLAYGPAIVMSALIRARSMPRRSQRHGLLSDLHHHCCGDDRALQSVMSPT